MIHRSPFPTSRSRTCRSPSTSWPAPASSATSPRSSTGPTGRALTYGELDDASRALAGGLVGARLRHGRRPRASCRRTSPSTPSCSTASRSPAASSPRSTRPTPSARCTTSSSTPAPGSWSRSPPFLDTRRGGRRGHARSRRSTSSARPRARRRSPSCSATRCSSRSPVDARRRRRAALLLGHDRAVQGRACSRTATWSRTSPSRRRRARCGDDDTIIAVLPFFHIYGMQVLMNYGPAARARRSSRCRASTSSSSCRLHQEHGDHPVVRRAADRGRAGEAPDGRPATTCRRCEQMFSGAAPLSAELGRSSAGSAARLRASSRATA